VLDPISAMILAFSTGFGIGKILVACGKKQPEKPEPEEPETTLENPFLTDPGVLIGLMEQRQREREFYSRPGPIWQNHRLWELNSLGTANLREESSEDSPTTFEPPLRPIRSQPQIVWRYNQGRRSRMGQ
jgi:hypothetical protein